MYDEGPPEDFPREMFEEAARYSLGTVGDAVDDRVARCLAEAKELLAARHLGASLTVAATALEIMIRLMIVRPFVGAAFLSDDWTEILMDRVINDRRSAEDRELLPALLRQVNVDLTTVKTRSGVQLWPTILEAWKVRNALVHRGDEPTTEIVNGAIECVEDFRQKVVSAVADALGFSHATTGQWSLIRTPIHERRFSAWDPFLKRRFGPP